MSKNILVDVGFDHPVNGMYFFNDNGSEINRSIHRPKHKYTVNALTDRRATRTVHSKYYVNPNGKFVQDDVDCHKFFIPNTRSDNQHHTIYVETVVDQKTHEFIKQYGFEGSFYSDVISNNKFGFYENKLMETFHKGYYFTGTYEDVYQHWNYANHTHNPECRNLQYSYDIKCPDCERLYVVNYNEDQDPLYHDHYIGDRETRGSFNCVCSKQINYSFNKQVVITLNVL